MQGRQHLSQKVVPVLQKDGVHCVVCLDILLIIQGMKWKRETICPVKSCI